MKFCVKSIAWLCLFAGALPASLSAVQRSNAAPASLPTAEASPLTAIPLHPDVNVIVQQMEQRNRVRAEELKSYIDLRHYSVSYHGFPADLSATMVVRAHYRAPDSKTFQIVSTSGSRLLVNHVLKKLLDAEQEAALHPDEASIAPANYTFTLLGTQTLDGSSCYILQADPKSSSHLLFQGKIWVDAADFAVTQLDAQPARSPSFWIRDTHIHHVYSRTGFFWLPHSDRSVTRVRFGGTAVLTIDYGVYHTVARDAAH
ncbi:MAG TPA: hypothetical protein VHX13_02605 [Acidobacteriaceae bacterium]|nr:hypothetical protein [Acidobacteriaceae bacterium]